MEHGKGDAASLPPALPSQCDRPARATLDWPRGLLNPSGIECLTLVCGCAGTSLMDALTKVLSLPAVHSKRFLTTKVDRCVTG